MIVRLWVLGKLARYIAYIPVIGWRFSDTIQEHVTGRLDRGIDIEAVDVTLEGPPPASLTVEVTVANSLPMEVSVSAATLRLGLDSEGKTLDTVQWAADTAGEALKHVSRERIEQDGTGTFAVERHLVWDVEGTLHVDGTVELQTWLDLPATKEIPVGSVHRRLPDATEPIPA